MVSRGLIPTLMGLGRIRRIKYILVTVVIVCIVFNILVAFHVLESPIAKQVANIIDEIMDGDCPPVPRINDLDEARRYAQNRTCQPSAPTAASCRYTAENFRVDESVEICHDQSVPPYELCTLSEARGGSDEPVVMCNLSPCDRKHGVQLRIVNPDNGGEMTRKYESTQTDRKMTEFVRQAIRKTRKNGFNFMYVECTGVDTGGKISQLLPFLPPPALSPPSRPRKVNINVVVVDSVARAHFYRSLPKTVAHLREKRADPAYNAHLLEFELFQSVHGHTHENEHAFFSGELYPDSFSKDEKARAPSNMEKLYGVMKEAGYQTLAQNDMCWRSVYGFMDSFKAADWKEMRRKLETNNSNIDSTGLTETSCKIYANYGRNSPFNDDDNHQICFNGQHQHKYFFDYIARSFQNVESIHNSKPLFAYMETNVNHDDRGVRIRTLDRDLPEFIDTVAELNNTITIIYADHGNTYTGYQYAMLEGRLEMYHPTLMTIIPKGLASELGRENLANIKTNRYRLLTVLDVRAGVVALANHSRGSQFRPAGIFGPIPANRTCNDLQLSTPVYCICEGWDIDVKNSAKKIALAEFGLGRLNNMIQHSLANGIKKRGRHNLFGTCQKLVLRNMSNIRERHMNGGLVTTMDVRVHSGNVVDQMELFTLQISEHRDNMTLVLKLISFNRISKYGQYRACADRGVGVKLCVCNKPERSNTTTPRPSAFQTRTLTKKLSACVFLASKSFEGMKEGHEVNVYELTNRCVEGTFRAFVNADTKNVLSSGSLPTVVKLPPRTTYFLMFAIKEDEDADLKIDWRIAIKAA